MGLSYEELAAKWAARDAESDSKRSQEHKNRVNKFVNEIISDEWSQKHISMLHFDLSRKELIDRAARTNIHRASQFTVSSVEAERLAAQAIASEYDGSVDPWSKTYSGEDTLVITLEFSTVIGEGYGIDGRTGKVWYFRSHTICVALGKKPGRYGQRVFVRSTYPVRDHVKHN